MGPPHLYALGHHLDTHGFPPTQVHKLPQVREEGVAVVGGSPEQERDEVSENTPQEAKHLDIGTSSSD